MRYALSLAMTLACVGSVHADEKPVEIPLKEIWAWNMPGTRNIRELEPERFGEQTRTLSSKARGDLYRGSLVNSVSHLLTAERPEGGWVQSGFAVSGAGQDALRQMRDVLAKKSPLPKSLPSNEEVTLVFFARPTGSYVHLQSVERHKHVITITYEFVLKMTKDLPCHFALIPIGTLEAGNWRVNVVQAPIRSEYYVHWGAKPDSFVEASKLVADSFCFEVVPSVESPDKAGASNPRRSSP